MDIRELVSVIQSYIHHRTGRTIDINLMDAQWNLGLTRHMYDYAVNWFRANGGRVEVVG